MARRNLARPTRKPMIRMQAIMILALRHAPLSLVGGAFLLMILSIASPNVWQGPRIAATDLFAPVLTTIAQPFHYVADVVGGMTGITQLKAENERLKSENARLKEWYQTALLLEAENRSLKDVLNVLPDPSQSYITTRVIADSGNSFVRSLLVAAGTHDGVDKGQAVMGGQGMIGRIIEPGSRASRVLLLTDINSRVPVVVEGANQRAILAGNNEDLLTLEHVPADTLIEDGARIVTSGHGGMFPAGLPIGRVAKDKDGTLYVRPFTDPNNANFIQIIEKPEDPNVRQSVDQLTAPEEPVALPSSAPQAASPSDE